MIKMNKKIIITLTIILLSLILVFCYFITYNKTSISEEYIIKIKLVDEKSPERKLELYSDNEKIDFKEIFLMEGLLLCDNKTPYVFYGEIMHIEKLMVRLEDNREIIARIEEVN